LLLRVLVLVVVYYGSGSEWEEEPSAASELLPDLAW
jgi:hypothetical protein